MKVMYHVNIMRGLRKMWTQCIQFQEDLNNASWHKPVGFVWRYRYRFGIVFLSAQLRIELLQIPLTILQQSHESR